jgi:Serine/threonine protein kinase
VLETFGKIFLVVEYASGGELYNKITTEGRLSEDDAKIYFLQILSAVKHLVRNLGNRRTKIGQNILIRPATRY